MVGTGKVGFTGVLVSTTVGSLLGFMSLFWAGSLLGRRFFIQRDIWVFKKKDIIRAEEWFRRFGYMLILVNRFFPGIRSVISIAGGISGLDGRRAALLALTSALVWNLIWISLGYAMGSNWDIVKEKTAHIMLRYNILILALAVIIAVLYMIIRSIRKNRGR